MQIFNNLVLAFAVMIVTAATAMGQAISGKIVDENNEPLDFVNVVLVSKSDSAFVAGTITDRNGSFLFENIAAKSAFVRFSSVGYQTSAQDILI